jgi:hypothetical protein
MRQSGLLFTIAFCATSMMQANDCIDVAEPIRVEAVCGQTLQGVGWREPGEDSDIFARIIPNSSLELVDSRSGVVLAESKSDAEGRFAFRSMPAGAYVLRTGRTFWQFSWPISVTRSRQPCSTPLYVYLGLPATTGCEGYASLKRPASIQR